MDLKNMTKTDLLRDSYYFCMDCDWEGKMSECEVDTEYDE